jgi:hypothetical protein
MPAYEENGQELTFTAQESTASVCPICNSDLDYGQSETQDDLLIRPWNCKCGSSGKEYGVVVFDGHNVDFTTMPIDMQIQYTGARSMCINRMLKVGDLVMAAIEDASFPCLPGRVTAIDVFGSMDHDTGNETDDVHIDFTGDYSDRRKREIEDVCTRLSGYRIPFEGIALDNVIMPPSNLIGISEIGERELTTIMASEENALRYAFKAVLALH